MIYTRLSRNGCKLRSITAAISKSLVSSNLFQVDMTISMALDIMAPIMQCTNIIDIEKILFTILGISHAERYVISTRNTGAL